jgi:hypothetical protein
MEVRRWRGLLSALLRFRGLTFVEVDRWTLAEELWSFGEDELYLRAVDMSDEDMIRVWTRAGKLYMKGEARSAGEAAALAAVEILEGNQRTLARSRRRPRAQRPWFGKTPEDRQNDIYDVAERKRLPM